MVENQTKKTLLMIRVPTQEVEVMSAKGTSWSQQMRHAYTKLDDLCQALQLDKHQAPFDLMDQHAFGLKVPEAYVQRMQAGNWRDPLLLQVLPVAKELEAVPGFVSDPLGELQANRQQGVLQKYQGRALLLLTGHCPVHCRYCFRRHYPYDAQQNSRQQWRDTLAQLAQDESLDELILSGGDPLSWTDESLSDLLLAIDTMPNIKRIRIHTRFLVMIPDRLTPALLSILSSLQKSLVIVFHCNHANEINAALASVIAKLQPIAQVLNQAVLLKGVNDNLLAQIQLSETFFDAGGLPYYLFLLDPVAGAAHFDVPTSHALVLHQQMLASLPGYLVPKLVKEVAGEHSKSPVLPYNE